MSDDDFIQKEQAPNWRLKSWFPDLDDKTIDKLKEYFVNLQKFNKVINLISSKTVVHADAIHYADSILACQIVRKNINKNISLYDFGSGNGFPGLVYGILYPDQKVVLVDSDERKCEFLKHIADSIGLTNIIVQNKKIEDIPADLVEQAVCRGFSPLPKALLSLRKSVRKGGVVFHLKSSEWAVEISQIPIQLCSIWQPSLEAEYNLPVGGIKMYIVRTTKIN